MKNFKNQVEFGFAPEAFNLMGERGADVQAAYDTLRWARTPGNHGGTNPYGQPHVRSAEHVVAAHEGREPEFWAGSPTVKAEGRAS